MKNTFWLFISTLTILFSACSAPDTEKLEEKESEKTSMEKGKEAEKPSSPADFWDQRFSKEEYVYGKTPNAFFKASLDQLPKGDILLVGEGEGRNAVYAAKQGWKVDAIDLSKEGKAKAEKLAAENEVEIHYEVANALTYETDKQYDVIAFVFLHLPKEIQKETYGRYVDMLKPGGKIVLELYTPEQLGNSSGGPKNKEMLVSKEDLEDIYQTLEMEYLEEVEVELNEGMHHKGMANTVRMIGVKK
jgi:SAM-dependent methyltransferase